MPSHTAAGDDDLMTVADLARRARVSVETVYRWNSDGSGPAYGRFGKHVRYRKADVDAWIDQRIRSTHTPGENRR